MNGMYCETCVKRKANASTYAAKAGVVLGVLVLLALSVLFAGSGLLGYVFMVLTAILVVAAFSLFPQLNVDYEYVFCDGQVDFDAIYGGNRRKNKLRVDFESLVSMAPERSHEVDSLRNGQMKTYDFSSGNADAAKYVMYINDSKTQAQVRIIFEPDEKFISLAKQKSPRKVFTD